MDLLKLAQLLLLLHSAMAALRKSSSCSVSFGCISNREQTIMLTWKPWAKHVHFTLRGYIGTGDRYVAVGLSHDDQMGDDDVTECVNKGGQVRVFSSVNKGRSNMRFLDKSLTNQSGVYDDGTITCSFSLPVSGHDVTDVPRHTLDRPWHVLLVWGYLAPGTDHKMQHLYVSSLPTKVNFKALGSFQTETLSRTMLHIHGSVLVIAWVALASIGTLVSRHYKGLLPDTQLGGTHVWYQVHRGLMTLVVVLTGVGVIAIFVEVGGYVEGADMEDVKQRLHPVLGLIVLVLSILNPVLAVFRPPPKSPRRPVFNWIHRFLGTSAHIIALVAVFLGLCLPRVQAPKSVLVVLGVFTAWHVIAEIVLFSFVHIRQREDPEASRSYAMQSKADADSQSSGPTKVSNFQELFLMLHSAVAIATSIFLLSQLLSS